MIGLSPRCYIPSFVEIGPPVQEKEDFWRVFTIYGHGGQLGHVTQIYWTNIRRRPPPPPLPMETPHKIQLDWPSGFREEDLWKCGRTTDNGRTPEHGYTISSPCQPNGSGELKTSCQSSYIGVKHEKKHQKTHSNTITAVQVIIETRTNSHAPNIHICKFTPECRFYSGLATSACEYTPE